MSSYCTFLLLLAAAAPGLAAPILDILADPCTGTAHPKASPPMCYSGGMSILGGTWTESVVLHVKEFDAATGKGFVAFDAEGASPQHCNKTPFTKATDSQDITVDFGHCISGATVDAKYCSDQDTVLIHVSVPNKHVPKVPVTLKPMSECPKRGGKGKGA